MTRKAWLALGAVAYSLALLLTTPATLLSTRVAAASGGRLVLAETHGTLWSGAARLELRDADGRSRLTQPVAWRLQPASLLAGRMHYDLAFERGHQAATMVLSRSRISFSGIDMELPAAALGATVPALAVLGLGGDVRIRVEYLAFEPLRTVGGATLQWRAASSSLSPVAPLGHYELRLEARGADFAANLRTVQGPLELMGHGVWQRTGGSTFVAIARMPPGLRPTLAPFLRLVAVERADGSFEWRLVPQVSA